jgi:hypothetical protein
MIFLVYPPLLLSSVLVDLKSITKYLSVNNPLLLFDESIFFNNTQIILDKSFDKGIILNIFLVTNSSLPFLFPGLGGLGFRRFKK